MESTFICLLLEIGISFIITLFLLIYYSRKKTKILVFVIAHITWFLNFVLVLFLPFDIYYTQTETGRSKEFPEKTKNTIELGYPIIYWMLFFLSWIIIPLIQSYESSGEFTKWEKFKSSLKENLIFYGVLAGISVVILIISLIKYGLKKTIDLAKDCSLIFGILVFFFLLSYSLIKYPKTLFEKLNFKRQIKYHEWRANQFYEKLDEIKYDLITRYIKLKLTIKNVTEMDDKDNDALSGDEFKKKKESINTSISNDKKKSSFQSDLSDKPRQIRDYLPYMEQKYNNFEENASLYGISIKKEKNYELKPILNLDELIDLNYKINKKENDSLKMQCRIRICYRRWVILKTISYLKKDYENDNNIINPQKKNLKNDNEEKNKDEKLIVKEDNKNLSLEEEGFIPLEDFSNIKLFYYTKIRIIFIYILFVLSIIAGVITVFCEILLLFKAKLLMKLLERINNIVVIHFVILIPLIYLICMSNYTLFKIKISSYIYMYGHRQTDSVSLMIFSSYLSRIYFAICLNVLQTLNQFSNEEDKKSLFEKFFGIVQDKDESNLIIKLCRFSPCILLSFMVLFFFNLPGKLGNFVGCNLFEFESEERDIGINDGHKYLMNLNKKLKGKQLGHHDSKIFEDK